MIAHFTSQTMFKGLVVCSLAGFMSCSPLSQTPELAMNGLAEQYVKLVLALGQHDKDYVDAYHGPSAWQEEAAQQKKPPEQIEREAQSLEAQLRRIDVSTAQEMVQLRHTYLTKQIGSMVTRTQMLQGKKLSFDEEARALYDAAPPTFPEQHFQEILDRLARLLPGKGSIAERYNAYKKGFIIPPQKLDTVFRIAIAEARARTVKHMTLPENESFDLEYVQNKSWSGYNWFKGNAHSLIQINTDLPIYIDRAIDLACHEGYPGHHVYNVLVEDHLLKKRGWIEFSVYPLFSPQSLIAEGSANFGIEVAFPGGERLEFEQETLFPLAGLDPKRSGQYYEVAAQVQQLTYSGNEAARRYLNEEINREQAAQWLERYALMAPDRAQQRVRFIDQYRSYVINYNLGQDLVRKYIEARGWTAEHPEKRWEEFRALISSPRLPGSLQ